MESRRKFVSGIILICIVVIVGGLLVKHYDNDHYGHKRVESASTWKNLRVAGISSSAMPEPVLVNLGTYEKDKITSEYKGYIIGHTPTAFQDSINNNWDYNMLSTDGMKIEYPSFFKPVYISLNPEEFKFNDVSGNMHFIVEKKNNNEGYTAEQYRDILLNSVKDKKVLLNSMQGNSFEIQYSKDGIVTWKYVMIGKSIEEISYVYKDSKFNLSQFGNIQNSSMESLAQKA